jgi:hypothetical protein
MSLTFFYSVLYTRGLGIVVSHVMVPQPPYMFSLCFLILFYTHGFEIVVLYVTVPHLYIPPFAF